MTRILLFFLLVLMVACSTRRPEFKSEQVCSNEALKYLKNPRNKSKNFSPDPGLIEEMVHTARSMQVCYEDFRNRSGPEEFSTCLVVGVDKSGKTEFFNFGSREAELDETFLNCASAVAKSVSFSSYGKDYVLIQSYEFYTRGP